VYSYFHLKQLTYFLGTPCIFVPQSFSIKIANESNTAAIKTSETSHDNMQNNLLLSCATLAMQLLSNQLKIIDHWSISLLWQLIKYCNYNRDILYVFINSLIHSFRSLSYDRSIASSFCTLSYDRSIASSFCSLSYDMSVASSFCSLSYDRSVASSKATLSPDYIASNGRVICE
jgi:hypothetical protein